MVILSNSFDPDQIPSNSVSDLVSRCLTLEQHFRRISKKRTGLNVNDNSVFVFFCGKIRIAIRIRNAPLQIVQCSRSTAAFPIRRLIRNFTMCFINIIIKVLESIKLCLY